MPEILTAPEETYKFARFISTRKKELDQWTIFHIELIDKESKIALDEIIQFVTFQSQDESCLIFRINKTRELFVVTNNDDNNPLTMLNQNIHANFENTQVRCNNLTINENSLEKLANILTKNADNDDESAKINIRRMKRVSNTIMVVDDDAMICKQFEKILAGLGTCVTKSTTEEFFETYRQYAPDILFLDIHLQTDHGPDMMKKLIANIDPHAHVVIVSADTFAKTIKEVKEKGAKGFVVKPFSRQQILAHVTKMPTFMPRTS